MRIGSLGILHDDLSESNHFGLTMCLTRQYCLSTNLPALSRNDSNKSPGRMHMRMLHGSLTDSPFNSQSNHRVKDCPY